jgi:uncharacterized protein (TIGR03437 family)
VDRYLLGSVLIAVTAAANLGAQRLSFQRRDITAGDGPVSVVVGDFNNDGNQDIAVAGSAGISVLLGNGDGTFRSPLGVILPPAVQFNYASRHLVTADFNADGKLDLAEGNSAVILLGRGDGTFQAPLSYGVPGPLAAGDLNMDGKPDLAIKKEVDRVSVLLGNGDGTFQTEVKFPAAAGQPGGVVIADFNGDGKPDLAVGGATFSGGYAILLGKGDGTFLQTFVSPACQGMCYGVPGYPLAVGDFNGDGKLDLISSYGFQVCRAQVLLGNGDGTFLAGQCFSAVGEDASSIVIADLDRDGHLDVVFGYGGFALDGDYQNLDIFLGNGDGSFGPDLSTSVGERPSSVAVGDFNGDGKLDLAVANENSNNISVLINRGSGVLLTALSAASLTATVAPESLASIFGPLPASGTASADPLAPATSLAGLTVRVRDRTATERLARLMYVSPVQANFEVPAGTSPGDATITVEGVSGATLSGTAQIQNQAPGIFSAGFDVPVAFAVRIEPDGTQTGISVFHCFNPGNCFLDPIILDERPVYLSLLGTGIRHRTALSNVVCTIGGISVPVEYAGAAPGLVGVDQVNLKLSAALKGGGSVSTLILNVDGQLANKVYVAVR